MHSLQFSLLFPTSHIIMNGKWIILILVHAIVLQEKLSQSAPADDPAAESKGNMQEMNGSEQATVRDAIDTLFEALKAKIEKLMNSKEGHTSNNKEYASNLETLELASKLPKDSYEAKQQLYEVFKRYNDRRLEIEEQINERLSEIDSELMSLATGTDCVRFYLKQKVSLGKSFVKSNSQKEITLRENSVPCPTNASDSKDEVADDEYVYNDCNDEYDDDDYKH